MMFLGVLCVLVFLASLILAIVSAFKKNGKSKKLLLLSAASFIAFAATAIVDGTSDELTRVKGVQHEKPSIFENAPQEFNSRWGETLENIKGSDLETLSYEETTAKPTENISISISAGQDNGLVNNITLMSNLKNEKIENQVLASKNIIALSDSTLSIKEIEMISNQIELNDTDFEDLSKSYIYKNIEYHLRDMQGVLIFNIFPK